MLAIFGGKMPHNVAIVPGGVTETLSEDKITNFLWRLNEVRRFIEESYIPDIIAVAKAYGDYFDIGRGCGRMLAYGGLASADGELFKTGVVNEDLKCEELDDENITEDVKYSWYADSSSGKQPAKGETKPDPKKKKGYSFLKSPRYKGKVYELGPLARMVCNYVQKDSKTKELIDSLLGQFNAQVDALFSVLGRHAARALETKLIADAMAEWLQKLKPGQPTITESEVPEQADGVGLTEAPRGGVGHWISIKGRKTARYQVITPTAWNASPKDDKDQPGPVEQALMGTKVKDSANPYEIVRIVRAFDPCLACSVHMLDAKGNESGRLRIV
jgi:hydrogenase large subunit